MQIPEYSDEKERTRAELVKLFSERIIEINNEIKKPFSDTRTLELTLGVNKVLYNDVLKGIH